MLLSEHLVAIPQGRTGLARRHTGSGSSREPHEGSLSYRINGCPSTIVPLTTVQHIHRRGCHQRRSADQCFLIKIKLWMMMSVIQMPRLVVGADKEKATGTF